MLLRSDNTSGKTSGPPAPPSPPGGMNGNGNTIETVKALIEKLEQLYKCKISALIQDNSGNTLFNYSENTSLNSASIIKLFIFDAILDLFGRIPETSEKIIPFAPAEHSKTEGTGILQHKTGDRYDYTLHDYVQFMIGNSDNIATNILIEELGLESINEHINASGFSQTQLRRRMYGFNIPRNAPNNITSADDVVRLLRRIQTDEKKRKLLTKLLSEADEKRYIAQGFSPDTNTLVKSGILRNIYHEAGYLVSGEDLYPFAIFTSHETGIDDDSTQQLFLDISRALSLVIKV